MAKRKSYRRLSCEFIAARRARVELLYRLGNGATQIVKILQAEAPYLIEGQADKVEVIWQDIAKYRRERRQAMKADLLALAMPGSRLQRELLGHPLS